MKLFIKTSFMKSLSIVLAAAILFASCKGKENGGLNSEKNIVIMTDTAKAAGSYLTDTGSAKMPVVVAPKVRASVADAPVTRTPRKSANNNNGSNSNSGNGGSYGTGSSSNGSTSSTSTRKKGWSKAAKGAAIGGIGGAVAGAVIGKGKGAVIGGVLGATGGYIIGRSKDKKDGRVKQ